MSEAYQQKEWELDSLIDNLSSIEHTYKEYKKEVENLNKSLREQRHFYLEKLQQKENIIKEVREWSKKLKYETLWQTTRKELEEILDTNGKYLNDEVEIIEEPKKIEKIEMCTGGIMSFDSVENITTELKDKINEIIDKLNEMEKE